MRASSRACLSFFLLAAPAGAAVFGVPSSLDPIADPPPGYFLLVGRDTGNLAAGDDIAPFFGDPTMTGCERSPVPVPGDPGDPCGQVFYIEVTDRRLQVDLYDPGLIEPDPGQQQGPQLDLSYDTDAAGAVMHYDLRDPAGGIQASATYGPDTQGAGGTNAGLVNLATINNAASGVWTLHAWLEDTGAADEEISVFGLSVPGYRVYTYYPVVGHASAGGAPPASSLAFGGPPLALYPWIHGATAGLQKDAPSDPGTPVFGLAMFNFDLDADPTADPDDNPAFGTPPPEIIGTTAMGAVSPTCSTSPEFCFVPSVDTTYVRERRAGFNQSNLVGTDHGIYTFELSGLDGTWGVTEQQAPPASPTDVNAFTLQIREWSAPIPDPNQAGTDFPRVPADGFPLWRYYLPMDAGLNGGVPTKEWMGIQAIGPSAPSVGVTETYTIQWEVHNPTEYPLSDFQAAIHVNDTTAGITPPDPASLAVTGPLTASLDDDPGSPCPNAGGTDPKRVVICGDLPAAQSATVSFDIEVTASSTDVLYLLGDGDPTDGAAIAGGARPTLADYLTPFQPGPARESMGPLLAPHVFPVPPPCSAQVAIDDPGQAFCAGAFDGLTSTGEVQSCPSGGVAEYRWSTTGGELCVDWTAGADVLALPAGACPRPTRTATYLVEIRCSTETTCTDSDQLEVTVLPEVRADAGDGWTLCPGESARLGREDPINGVRTGQVIGKDSCTELEYQWDPVTGLSPSNGVCGACADAVSCWYPVASPSVDTTYTVTVTDPSTGCSAQSSVEIRVATDDVPSPVGCSLRMARSGGYDLRISWTDAPEPSGDYEVVALEPNADPRPCADRLPGTWPPDLAAMDAAPVVATVPAGQQEAVHTDGAVTCPRLVVYKVRPTSPCSGATAGFQPPACN